MAKNVFENGNTLTGFALSLQEEVQKPTEKIDQKFSPLTAAKNINDPKYLEKEKAMLKEFNDIENAEKVLFEKLKEATKNKTTGDFFDVGEINKMKKNQDLGKDENGNKKYAYKMGNNPLPKDLNSGELLKIQKEYEKILERKANFLRTYQKENTNNLTMFSTESAILANVIYGGEVMAGNCGVSASFALAGGFDPRLHIDGFKNLKDTRLQANGKAELSRLADAHGYIDYLNNGDKGLQPMGTIKDYVKPGVSKLEQDPQKLLKQIDWSKFQPGDVIFFEKGQFSRNGKPNDDPHGHAFIFLGTKKDGSPIFRSDGEQKTLNYTGRLNPVGGASSKLDKFHVFRNDTTIATNALGLEKAEFLELEGRYNEPSQKIIDMLIQNPEETFRQAGLEPNQKVIDKINELKANPEKIKTTLGSVFSEKYEFSLAQKQLEKAGGFKEVAKNITDEAKAQKDSAKAEQELAKQEKARIKELNKELKAEIKDVKKGKADGINFAEWNEKFLARLDKKDLDKKENATFSDIVAQKADSKQSFNFSSLFTKDNSNNYAMSNESYKPSESSFLASYNNELKSLQQGGNTMSSTDTMESKESANNIVRHRA